MKMTVVGATGMVGRTILDVLEERNFPVDELIPAASRRSLGKVLPFGGGVVEVVSVESALEAGADVAIFSAGGGVSKAFAPRFAERGTIVIDNSSAWRLDPNVPLVVPEVNASDLTPDHKIIANPNCSTIQLVVALNRLHREYQLDRIVINTYQSVTGTGVAAVRQLDDERSSGYTDHMIYPHAIHNNVLPHGGDFLDDGYTTEERKLVDETRKIFSDKSIGVSATVVRVPVTGGHSEAVNVTFKKAVSLEELRTTLAKTEGVTIRDEPDSHVYPMPIDAEGRDDVFVGRIRIDDTMPNTFNMWIVSDNLRKGAATNAVQIAELLTK